MMEYVLGDATIPIPFDKERMLLIHIVNNRGGWGKGFVVALSNRYKEPEQEYRSWYKSNNPIVPFELGAIQAVSVSSNLIVVNMLAQNGYMSDKNKIPLNINALRTCLKSVRNIALQHKFSIHMPKIGTGLAGSNWIEISKIIEEELKDLNIRVYTQT